MCNGWKRFTTLLCSMIPSSFSFQLSSFCPPGSSVLPSRLSSYSSCSLPPPSLPTLSHFSPLIHLSDFTRTQGDPGQTSCRGNRQRRNILYFFLLFSFFFTKERRAAKSRLMYVTETDRRGRAQGFGVMIQFAYMLLSVGVSASGYKNGNMENV